MTKIKEAIHILAQGGIVIFPTDTAFGIGCRIDLPQTIKKLFKIRKRPLNQPMPVLVSTIAMAQKYWRSPLPHIVRRLTQKYWPGGLTIIYKCNTSKVSPLIRNGANLGMRMPKHQIALDLISGIKLPILGPSANFHGEATPFLFTDLDKGLIKSVDFVLPGECIYKKVSTVVDCTADPFKIIRRGAVDLN